MSSESRVCQNCKNQFLIEPDDCSFYEKIKIPSPTFCPMCRMQRRFSFRNDRSLFKRTCANCKKDVISIYHPESPYVVYCQSCWWSDTWDPLQYGAEYDLSKPFFEQFDALFKRTPIMANFIVDESRMVNSPYNNMVLDLKNCYLLFDSDFNEECSYGCELEKSKQCVDTNLASECELCYEIVNCHKCYKTFWSRDCETCNEVYFSQDLRDCQNCFGCVGLRSKSYHIFNQPYTKEEYKEKLKQFNVPSYLNVQKHRRKSGDFAKKHIRKYIHGIQNQKVSGDYIYNSKNTLNSWITYGAEDSRYLQYQVAPSTKESYDITQFGARTEFCCEIQQGGNGVSSARFSWFVLNESHDIDYSIQIMGSANLFGCVSMRKKEYCILNKQYSKEEYLTLREKILQQMQTIPYADRKGRVYRYGEFFPSDISPFAYNETTAQEYFPLTKEEVGAQGFQPWREPAERSYKVTLSADDLPDAVDQAKDSLLQEIIGCEHAGTCLHACTKAFRIIPSELAFYKQFSLPLPHLCPNCRHSERLELRNSPRAWQGKCACGGASDSSNIYQNTVAHFHGDETCPNKFETNYDPKNKEIVYCEQCYQSEVI